MLKANKTRIYLFVSVIIFLLCSSVNMIPARVFLDEVKRYSKRQGGLGPDFDFCSDLKIPCHGFVCFQRDEQDPEHKCLVCADVTDATGSHKYCIPDLDR